ncbi:MbtH family protein [Rhizobium leguminosarum]
MENQDQLFSDSEYHVVVNHEDQYSIWPVGRKIPDGWRSSGFRGSKADCLKHIAEVWTDITPKSLRQSIVV